VNIHEELHALFGTTRTVVPIVPFLSVFQVLVLRTPIENTRSFIIGTLLIFFGLHLFLRGISASLLPLGDAVGRNLVVMDNKIIIAVVAFVIGYLATLVEPALKVLAMEVEEVSVGAIPSTVLVHTVAIGFGVGMCIGVIKIIHGIPTKMLLLPILVLAVVLGFFAPREFVDIAIDSASATTGPVNIPLNMAIALGLSKVLEHADPLLSGFGIVGLTSMGAVVSVLALGVISR